MGQTEDEGWDLVDSQSSYAEILTKGQTHRIMPTDRPYEIGRKLPSTKLNHQKSYSLKTISKKEKQPEVRIANGWEEDNTTPHQRRSGCTTSTTLPKPITDVSK